MIVSTEKPDFDELGPEYNIGPLGRLDMHPTNEAFWLLQDRVAVLEKRLIAVEKLMMKIQSDDMWD